MIRNLPGDSLRKTPICTDVAVRLATLEIENKQYAASITCNRRNAGQLLRLQTLQPVSGARVEQPANDACLFGGEKTDLRIRQPAERSGAGVD